MSEKFDQKKGISCEVRDLFHFGGGLRELFKKFPATYKEDPQYAVDLLGEVINFLRCKHGLAPREKSFVLNGFRFDGPTDEEREFSKRMFNTQIQEIDVSKISNGDFFSYYYEDALGALSYLEYAAFILGGKLQCGPVFLKANNGDFQILQVTGTKARWGYESYLTCILVGLDKVDAVVC